MANIVLVHGAYQGVLGLAARCGLAERGWAPRVFAPSFDGCAWNAAMRCGPESAPRRTERRSPSCLVFEDLSDVVLVGTSSGGMVVCSAAERARERVGRLVFADALALFDGECIPDIVKRVMRRRPISAIGPSREDAAGRMFASLDDATKTWALERYTPHPAVAMNGRVKLPNFWQQTWKASVIWCRQAVNSHARRISVGRPRSCTRHGTSWIPGTYPMLTAADELSRLIVEG